MGVFLPLAAAHGELIKPGDLAFVGFNADGQDDFAIVLLADAEAGTIVRLSDREWLGSTFSSGEGAVSWTLSHGLAAGTVVTFSNVDHASNLDFGPSSGSLSGALQLAVGGETLYAYLGPTFATPSTFLAAISTVAGDYNGGSGTLNGTGLTLGTTAVLLPGGTRGGEYSGIRSSESGYADFLQAIGNPADNWTISTTDGTDVLPFNTQQMIATPEPAMWSLAVISALLLAFRMRHRSASRMHDLSAVDVPGLAGDILCTVRGKEHGQGGYVFTRLPAAEGNDAANFFLRPCFVRLPQFDRLLIVPGLPDRLVECGLDHSRTDGIHANVIGS
jgi:hypothetical protein